MKTNLEMRKETKETNKLYWHWEIDFRDALVIFVVWDYQSLELTFWYMRDVECLICLNLHLLTQFILEMFDKSYGLVVSWTI